MQCAGNLLEAKVDFIIDLYAKLMKLKLNTISDQVICNMIADIREYSRNRDKFRTNQGHPGIKNLFRSFAISLWEGANFRLNKYRKYNEVLIKKNTKYYYTSWAHCNEQIHNPQVQRARIIN